MKKYYVYYHRDPREEYLGWKRYIGKGQKNRAYSLSNRYSAHKNWISHLKHLDLKPIVEIVEWFDTEEEAFKKEVELINKYKDKNYIIYNCTNGGDGVSGLSGNKSYWYGKKRSIENRKKISDSRKGKSNPAVAEANKNRKQSNKFKKDLSDRMVGNTYRRGKKVSQKTKDTISDKLKNNTYSARKILCINNNTIYPSIKITCQSLGLSYTLVQNVLKNRQASTKGFFFIYAD
jgi:hypothetical protein